MKQPDGFEARLLEELEDVDARTAPADRAAPFTPAPRRRLPRALVPIAAAVVLLTGGATAVAVLTGDATFQVAAEAVETDGVVIAKGSGCGPGREVTIRFGKTILTQVLATEEGTFIAEAPLPDGTQPGIHALLASCRTAEGEMLGQGVKLRVFSEAPVTAASFAIGGTGSPGGVVLVKGTGCASTPVHLTFDGEPAGTAAVLDGGTFSGHITVPASADAGEHEAGATCFTPSGKLLVQKAPLGVVLAAPEPAPSKT